MGVCDLSSASQRILGGNGDISSHSLPPGQLLHLPRPRAAIDLSPHPGVVPLLIHLPVCLLHGGSSGKVAWRTVERRVERGYRTSSPRLPPGEGGNDGSCYIVELPKPCATSWMWGSRGSQQPPLVTEDCEGCAPAEVEGSELTVNALYGGLDDVASVPFSLSALPPT